MSQEIASKIDSFSTRISDLEGQIKDLMTESGLGPAGTGEEGVAGFGEPSLLAEEAAGFGEGKA